MNGRVPPTSNVGRRYPDIAMVGCAGGGTVAWPRPQESRTGGRPSPTETPFFIPGSGTFTGRAGSRRERDRDGATPVDL